MTQIDDYMDSPAIQRWLSRLGKTTARNYASWWGAWWSYLQEYGGDFSDKTPEQLVEYQQGCSNGDRYKILDLAQSYILSLDESRVAEDKKKLRANTKRNYYRMIRSFFAHNRAELPNDPHWSISSDVPKVRGKLKPEHIRDIVQRSSPMYRAVFLSMFQGALGLEEFMHWDRNGLNELREQLAAHSLLVKINLPGRKKNKNDNPYFTWIGKDAVDAVKQWMRIRHEDSELRGYPNIFYTQQGTPLNKKTLWRYWKRQLVAIGLIEKKSSHTGNRYGYNPHEMRDCFRTQWGFSGAAKHVGEYCMGHIVDSLGYDKSADDEVFSRSEYLKALPFLNVVSDSKTPYRLSDEAETVVKIQEQDNTIETLQEQMAAMAQQVEDQRNQLIDALSMISALTPEQQREALRRLKEGQ